MTTEKTYIPDQALVISPMMRLKPEWIDFNGHLNMAYYNVLFDQGYDAVCVELGLGPEYAENRKLTTYTGEIHLRYVHEIHLNHPIHYTFQPIMYN